MVRFFFIETPTQAMALHQQPGSRTFKMRMPSQLTSVQDRFNDPLRVVGAALGGVAVTRVAKREWRSETGAQNRADAQYSHQR